MADTVGKPYWNPSKGDQVLWKGTFVLNGATPVTVSGVHLVSALQSIVISLNTPGGTVGALPAIQTLTPSATPGAGSFTIAGTAGDTSTYNYMIL